MLLFIAEYFDLGVAKLIHGALVRDLHTTESAPQGLAHSYTFKTYILNNLRL